ncbi:cilia- and flagella-associated protein 57 [Coccinella septempunctata]|uniref:cilia- and flagella-associated protein 57 n=1 Tax=Coccinella septempunctata TaxID=41139 RepID=UPI001D06E437|nr:cilia- and flagella-associated protein 57 [Coccinella septempunctata]
MTTASLPILQPRLLLGLQTHLQGNAQFISDEEILYPVGSVLALHNINQKRQKYIRLPEKGKNVTSIVVSPNKKLIAVVESGEKPQVTLYDTKTYKRKKQITIPVDKGENCYATRFAAVAFTQDSRNIICVSGEPDWLLYSFKSDKGKLESTARANNANGTGTVLEIAGNPVDSNQLVLVGEGLLRMLQCADFQWRQFGYSKSDQMVLNTACWLSQDRILIGTKDGKFLFLESGELKTIFHANDLPVMNLRIKEEAQPQTGSQTSIPLDAFVSSEEEGQNYCIKSLINFSRGFAFGYMNGTVHLYEKETPHKYRKRNVFRIPDHTIVREYEKASDEVMAEVNCISINPAQDRLMVSCRESQLYSVRLWLQDINSSAEVAFSEFGYVLHNGPVGSMAVCSWKPILLTAGQKDRTLKIWNYETAELELGQKYQDDIYGVALHPTGLYCIVGFSDKLRYLTIMIDEFTINREFPIRVCKQCSFSQMGHYFAAANGNLIQVYSSITFEMFYTLKGHNGKITGMSWTADDIKLSTCGSEGAVYEWNVTESKRTAETIIKTCPFNDCVVSSDGKSTMAVGKDGHIRELINSVIYRDVVLLNTALDSIVLSRLDTMLFVTGNNGVVFSVKLPLMEKLDTLEFNMHSSTVTNMLISANDKFILTGAEDGSICFWRILNTDGKAIKMDKEFAVAREILISREVLEDKLNQIRDLHLRMHELETEFAYQMRQNDVVHNLRMKDVHQGYCSAIEELKEKNEQLESDHQQELHNINMEINKMKQAHEQFVHKLEANYNEKLIYEYDKYMRLEEKMDKMRLEYEQQLEDLRQAKADTEETITNSFLEKLQEKDAQHDELIEQARQRTEQHELIKQQIEDDADREIYELKAAHEKELKEEQDLNVRIRGETAMVKKKLITSQKEIDDLKHTVYLLESDHTKFKGVIVDREKDIADLKKEIAERDQTIQDKERRIYDLKRKNQELEKFKFILDFKIKELKSQIEPKERTIREQVEQINEMVRELENLQKIILSLDLQLDELKEKLAASDNEVRIEVAKNRRMKEALKSLRTDIHKASGYIQDVPMLIKTIRNIYHKYNADKDFAMAQEEDKEAKSEFLRQREFLERTVSKLKERVIRNQSSVGVDKFRLVEENALLLVETNNLRYNLRNEQRQNKKLQSVLGFSKKYVLPRVAQQKLHNAIATREEIRDEYQNKLDADEKALAVMAGENQRLLKMVAGGDDAEDDEDEENGDYNDDEAGGSMQYNTIEGALALKKPESKARDSEELD